MKKLVLSFGVILFAGQVLFGIDEIVSPLAGKWYPANKEFLQLQIEKYLDNAKPQKLSDVIALVLPHAAYVYSGQTAAFGIKEIAGGKYRRVIIMGPSHHSAMTNAFSVPDARIYTTPLGSVPVDTEFIAKLKKFPECSQENLYLHMNEHSIQMEIPLLQVALTDFKIVPIVLGALDYDSVRKIGDQLKPLLDPDTLVVVSSDFTHYGSSFSYLPFPVDNNTEANLKGLDTKAVKLILDKDTGGLFKFEKETMDTICGISGVELLTYVLPSASKAYELDYSTSGRMTGDFSNSVSYNAMAFTGKWEGKAPVDAQIPDNTVVKSSGLSEKDKDILLSLAQKSIAFYMEKHQVPDPGDVDIAITAPLKENRGVFVTLKENGELRGCIGEILPTRPLYLAVISQAVNSAFGDRRFRPVSRMELPMLSYEISVLTPPVKVKSWKDIVLGRDGIIMEKNGASAVFLPQVAAEQKWGIRETLSNLSIKAGLQSDAWEEGAAFMVFQAEVFSMENDAPARK